MDKISLKTLIVLLFLSLGWQAALAQEPTDTPEIYSTQEAVNINTANAEELAEALNGIGLSKAQAIVDYRENYGSFAAIDELADVKGIGSKTVEKNSHLIVLN